MRSIATLVVDDNDAYRAGLIEYLHTQAGVDIVGEAEDGSEAILLTQELDPDLVLMDISMPGIGGLEATRVIKEQHAKVKVVLVLHYSGLDTSGLIKELAAVANAPATPVHRAHA